MSEKHQSPCKGCSKPVREGEHRWARREPDEHWHYDCATQAGLTDTYNPFAGSAPAVTRRPKDKG